MCIIVVVILIIVVVVSTMPLHFKREQFMKYSQKL